MTNITPTRVRDEKHAALLLERVKTLGKHLGKTKTSKPINGKTSPASPSGDLTLMTALFGKAPLEFLEQRSVEELAAVVQLTKRTLDEHTAQRDLVILTGAGVNTIQISIALLDRPFIVNTLTECLRRVGAELRVILHPVIDHPDTTAKISLTYLEIASSDTITAATISEALSAALKQVILATDDFSLMRDAASRAATSIAAFAGNTTYGSPICQEAAAFTNWLIDGGFVFLGSISWSAEKRSPINDTNRGLLRGTQSQIIRKDLEADLRQILNGDFAIDGNPLVHITRSSIEPGIHRPGRLTHVLLTELDASGKPSARHSFVGLLTSKALAQEASSIPLIRQKLHAVVAAEKVNEGGHDYKSIVNIIDTMPKDEALRYDVATIRELVQTIMGGLHRDETRVHVTIDPAHRSASVLVVMPRDRFNSALRARIQQLLEESCHAPRGSSEYQLGVTNKPLVRLFFAVPLDNTAGAPNHAATVVIDADTIRRRIVELSLTWRENLREAIRLTASFKNQSQILSKYQDAFPETYQALQKPTEALADILEMENLSSATPVRVALAPRSSSAETLIVYNIGPEITISRALPTLEYAGFSVISENSAQVKPANSDAIFIHRYQVSTTSGQPLDIQRFHTIVAPGLALILAQQASADPLASLMIEVGLDINALAVLRAYCRLLWQVQKVSTRRGIRRTLASQPTLAVLFWKMFETRFNPNLKLKTADRAKQFDTLLAEYKDGLRAVTDLTKDKVFRGLSVLLENTVRTNFYQPNKHSTGAPGTIALKIASSKIEIMPQPRPIYEIFVSSLTVEGVHLRGAKVARGGIRWSDRPEDFRSEVLGLMKTQKVKNVLIVPGGAKGGFVPKRLPLDPALIPAGVEGAYREFVRALLSLTDNRVDDKIVTPPNLITYDEPDPYIVVAADKGTARFSDTANSIAVDEYSFWLGDAFASGGSNGYDHKIYAITAKGAWECVRRHFHDLGINYTTAPFTVIGIGDMSGDVFGNGLLLSDQAKLLAAFDHRHIFLDPNPDPAKSFGERKRLFQLPRSSWADYNAKLLSSGGAIFPRLEKEIRVSPQVRAALQFGPDVPEVMNGEQLINQILRAEVALLWNGGIGTYFKAANETHADCSDSSNDRVRINAEEIRAKVVGEGGNLGFTQKARVAFAMRGGRNNTDAIDNSGGVDLSDHEVNLKILFARLMQQKKITLPDRNKVLKEMAAEVCELVLQHNRSHGLLLTLAAERSRQSIEYYQSLIRELVRMGYLNRALESLPDDDELERRGRSGAGLTRPELAVCTAAVKMWVKDVFLASDLPTDPLLQPFLENYFPSAIQRRFKEGARQHPLAANIIATEVAATVVDCFGVTFIHRVSQTSGTTPLQVIRCMLATELILGNRAGRIALQEIDTVADNQVFLNLVRQLLTMSVDFATWLVRRHGNETSLKALVELYADPFLEASKNGKLLAKFGSTSDPLAGLTAAQINKLPPNLRSILGVQNRTIAVLELLRTADQAKQKVSAIAETFACVATAIGAPTLLDLGEKVQPKSRWERELQASALGDVRDAVAALTLRLQKKKITTAPAINDVLTNSAEFQKIKADIDHLNRRDRSLAGLVVVSRELADFVERV